MPLLNAANQIPNPRYTQIRKTGIYLLPILTQSLSPLSHFMHIILSFVRLL